MPANWIVAVSVLVVFLTNKGEGEDLELRCPAFTDGEVNTLTANVNKPAVDNAECTLPARHVTFSRKRVSDDPNGPVLTMCQTDFTCPNPGPVSTPAAGEELCGCVKKEGDILTFEVKFLVNKTLDTAANYSFQLCAGPANKPSEDYDKSCTKVFVGSKDDGGSNTGAIVGGVIGAAAVVGVVIGIICYRVRKNKGRKSNQDKAEAEKEEKVALDSTSQPQKQSNEQT